MESWVMPHLERKLAAHHRNPREGEEVGAGMSKPSFCTQLDSSGAADGGGGGSESVHTCESASAKAVSSSLTALRSPKGAISSCARVRYWQDVDGGRQHWPWELKQMGCMGFYTSSLVPAQEFTPQSVH